MENVLKEIPKYTRDSIVIARRIASEGNRTEIIWVNPAFSEITGYSFHEAVGQNPKFLHGPETDLDTIKRIREGLDKGDPIREEILNYRKDGTPYWIEVNITPIDAENLEPGYFVSVQRDITERHALEHDLLEAKEMAEAASQAKSAFLAMMSHELRTPLNSILGFAQLLQMDPEANEKYGDFLGNIRTSGDLLLRVIGDILDIAKLEADQFEFEDSEFSIKEELEHATAAWSQRADNKGLKLVVENNTSHDTLVADKSRIRQVLNNVVLNAIKYTFEGQISLHAALRHTEESVAYLDVVVEDSGIGIESSRLERIFDPFFRGDRDIVLAQEGVGLGLTICLRILSEMNGTIEVESQPGKGSIFRMSFPVELSGESARPAKPQVNQGAALKDTQLRVLVAEDNAMNQRVMASLLTALGYDFDMVGNGKEAVEAVSACAYAVVLMDISMPVMSGDMATRVIRAMEPPHCNVPVVAVTAHAMKGDQEKLMAAGFSDYLPKPIDVAGLAAALARHTRADEPEAASA